MGLPGSKSYVVKPSDLSRALPSDGGSTLEEAASSGGGVLADGGAGGG